MQPEKENKIFSLAAEVVNFTSSNLFLTGKAGTGKTTFLKYIREHTHKNTAVVAPTGVAAINAGGVTMHSFFQLPFIPFLPEQVVTSGNVNFVNRHSLFKGLRFSKEKLDVINELELLIIDEVSMLRADLLDAIDEIMRHIRGKRKLPFGGVQVLFIGDLYQLPPVAKEDDWKMMREHYASPFFFSAKVLEQNPPLFIELKTIYRQSDEKFICLLNNIRNNELSEEDYGLLQERYHPNATDLKPGSITLTTHNHMADAINQRELQKIKTPSHKFSGVIQGNFSDKALPTEMQLNLKTGAQVMFVKNDLSPEKKYFNGKLATVKKIDEKGILVELSGSKNELLLTKEKWRNVQYKLDKETGKVEEEELGSFTQYPIRLAWAITIHKSQGLTFDHAVIDAGQSFAAGQVYVALSRCRTLEGLLLLSKIHPSSVKSDERIIEFSNKVNSADEVQKNLSQEKPKYAAKILMKAFDWEKLTAELEQFEEETRSKKIPDKLLAENTTSKMLNKAKEQQSVAEKFMEEFEKKFLEDPIDESWLNKKVIGAKKFFIDQIHKELLLPLNELQAHLKGKSKVRKYSKQVNELEGILLRKIKDVQRASFGDLAFEVSPILIERKEIIAAPSKTKALKGSSKFETLSFYKQGLSIEEIAKQRAMSTITIEGHLAEFVPGGEINVFDFLDKLLLEKIRLAGEKAGFERLTPLKEILGNQASYGQIRMAVNYLTLRQAQGDNNE